MLYLFSATILCSAQLVSAQNPRPNILFILADDLGVGDLGVTGQLERDANGLPAISTPNLDSIANNGMRFNQVYATAPMCEPTRAAMLTGFHQGHSINDRNDTAKWIRNGQEDKTYGQVMQEAGYATGYFGKMHASGVMGWRSTIDDVNSIPTAKGFADVMLTNDYNGPNQWEDDGQGGMVNVGNPTGIYNQSIVVDRAVSMIQNQVAADQSFMITTSFYGVHSDVNEVPQPHDYTNRSWSTAEKDYAATLTYLDNQVGRMLAVLDDPDGNGDNSDSVLDNTIIVFGSDNGNQNVDGHSPAFFGSTYDSSKGVMLRGVKFNVYEGGIRSPFLVQWGDKIKPGAVNQPGDVNDTFIGTFADLLPTFAEAAGVDAPLGIDGRSMLSDLTGEAPSERPDYFLWGSNKNRAGGSRGWAIRMQDWKLVNRMGAGTFELYNLADDPAEGTNLVSSRPDIKNALETLALAEGAQDIGEEGSGNTYFVQYKNWSPAGGSTDLNAAANWAGGTPTQNSDGTGQPADFFNSQPANNWLATVYNSAGTADQTVDVTDDAEVLALEVGGTANRMTVNVARHQELFARNEVRLSDQGRINLRDATLKTMRTVDVRPGSELTGHGTISGNQELLAGIAELENQGLLEPHVINGGIVAPGLPDDLPAPPPPGPPPNFSNISIENGDFQQPTYDGAPGIVPGTVVGWVEESASHSSIDEQAGNLAPSSFSQVGRLHDNTNAAINQDLNYDWSLGEKLTLSFDAWEAGWKIGVAGDSVVFELRETSGALLWDSGVIDLDDTLTGTQGNIVSGPVNSSFSFDIDTDNFTTGTPGSELNLRIRYSSGVSWFDDLTLTSDLVTAQPNVNIDATGLLAIEGDYTQLADGELAIDLGGTDNSDPLAAQFDQLLVSDAAEIDGTLSVDLVDSYTPALGDQFIVLSAASVAGEFHTIQSENLPAGLQWDVQYNPGNVTLLVVSALAADFDNDLDVDAADLGIWHASYGLDAGADANGDGVTNGVDFLILQRELGLNLNPSGSATVSVPEPSSLLTVCPSTLMLMLFARVRN